MEWIQVSIVVASNIILGAIFMTWSGKEGKAFRKKIREAI